MQYDKFQDFRDTTLESAALPGGAWLAPVMAFRPRGDATYRAFFRPPRLGSGSGS
jgi:hypothetical protein